MGGAVQLIPVRTTAPEGTGQGGSAHVLRESLRSLRQPSCHSARPLSCPKSGPPRAETVGIRLEETQRFILISTCDILI